MKNLSFRSFLASSWPATVRWLQPRQLPLPMNNALGAAAQIYACIYVLSVPLARYGRNHRSLITNSAIFQRLNSVLIVNYGYLCFCVAYATFCMATRDASRKREPRLSFHRAVKIAFYFVLALAINNWFFGPLVVERLNVATGGHCVDSDGTLLGASLRMYECRENTDFDWVDGFDLSGHFYFLVTLCMLLIDSVSMWARDLERAGIRSVFAALQQKPRALRVALSLQVVILAAWLFELAVTAIFFHTLTEKAAGLTVAFAFVYLWCAAAERLVPVHWEQASVSQV